MDVRNPEIVTDLDRRGVSLFLYLAAVVENNLDSFPFGRVDFWVWLVSAGLILLWVVSWHGLNNKV